MLSSLAATRTPLLLSRSTPRFLPHSPLALSLLRPSHLSTSSPTIHNLSSLTRRALPSTSSTCSSSSSPFFTPSFRTLSTPASPPPSSPSSPPPPPAPTPPTEKHENIYTLPNAITVARIAATPAIGYYILQGNWEVATGLLFVAGVSDVVDGWIARRWNLGTVLGSILDPAADKLLMTTLVVTLTMKDMLPLPLAVIILGRDVLLSLSAFYFRYASLPPPKTFARYWDFSLPSASVQPTTLSKYNTFLQLVLVGLTTFSPVLPWEMGQGLEVLQYVVAASTIASGLSYVGTGSGAAVKYLK